MRRTTRWRILSNTLIVCCHPTARRADARKFCPPAQKGWRNGNGPTAAFLHHRKHSSRPQRGAHLPDWLAQSRDPESAAIRCSRIPDGRLCQHVGPRRPKLAWSLFCRWRSVCQAQHRSLFLFAWLQKMVYSWVSLEESHGRGAGQDRRVFLLRAARFPPWPLKENKSNAGLSKWQCDKVAGVKRRQGDVPWDAVHRTLKLQYQPRRKVYTDDAVIAEPV